MCTGLRQEKRFTPCLGDILAELLFADQEHGANQFADKRQVAGVGKPFMRPCMCPKPTLRLIIALDREREPIRHISPQEWS